MSTSTKKFSIASLFLSLMLVFALAGCGSDPADAALDDLEKMVVSIEELAKKDTVTMAEYEKVMKDSQEMMEKHAKSAADAKPATKEQQERVTKLTERMTAAIQTIVPKLAQ